MSETNATRKADAIAAANRAVEAARNGTPEQQAAAARQLATANAMPD